MNKKFFIIAKSLAVIVAGIVVNHVPSLAPFKEELNTALFSGGSLLIGWLAMRHADRMQVVKEVQSIVGAPQTGKMTPDMGIIIADAIATAPTPEIKQKASDVIIKLTPEEQI